jgi:large subunit ribosomal protein L6
MSRIGKKPIIIPEGVEVEQKDSSILVSGPCGSLQMSCHPYIKVEIDKKASQVLIKNEQPQDRFHKQLHGTMRALIANMITGVSKGYKKKMELYGTGYNVKEQSGKLIFQVGFAHPVERIIPKGIKVNIEVGAAKGEDTAAKFTLSGVDKCVLGQFAANIRRIKPPEPYKAKGIRYAGEHIRRKVGKAFTSGTA